MRVGFYGDSTQRGSTFKSGGYVTSEQNVPTLTSALLSVDFDNNAIGGTTAVQWLQGRGAVPQSWAAEMAASTANVVLINPAINDVFEVGWDGQPVGTTGLSQKKLDFRYCYAEFARIARAAGKVIVFQTPNPIDDGHNVMLWEAQHQLKDVAQGLNVPVIDQWAAITAACPNWRQMLPDRIHPSDELYRFMAYVAHMTLAPILKGLQ